MLFDRVDYRVVKLEVVRHLNQATAGDLHPGRQVVDDPVAYILHAGCSQQVGRAVGLAQAGAEPAARALSGEGSEFVQRLRDTSRFVVIGRYGLLIDAMADE